MKLIHDWKSAWRFASVQATALMGMIAATIAAFPDLMIMFAQLVGGSSGVQAVVVFATFVIIILRLWNQGADSDEELVNGGNKEDPDATDTQEV